MSIRAKTKKRVLILLVSVLVLIGVATAFVLVRLNQREQEAARQRTAALKAVEEGRYKDAIGHFAKYNVGQREDAQALYQYAVARQHVEMPEYGHIKRALTAYNRVLDLDPENEKARRKLLEINQWARRETETVDLADQILSRHPRDVQALRAKATALSRMRNFEEAMKAAGKLIEAAPDDLRAHVLMLGVMNKIGRTDEQVIAYARKLQKEDPESPRAQMLLGYAYALSGDRQQAAQWLKRAAEGKPPDDRFVRMLLAQLNGLGLYDEAMSLLSRYAPRTKDADLRRKYVHRLWQKHRYDDLRSFLSGLDAESPEADSEMLAFKAMVLARAGASEKADAVIDALASRQGDNTAAAWAPVLREIVVNPDRSAEGTVEVARASLELDPGNPYIRFLLANAYAELGENELAIQQWRNTAQLAPSWSLPFARLATAYTETNRDAQALRYAQAAVQRAPRNKTAVFSMAQARAAAIEAGVSTGDSPQRLLRLLSEVQKASPGEPRTLPLYIDYLARTGQVDQARDQLGQALREDDQIPPQKALIRLANVSRKHGLGMTDQALALSEKAHGLTPGLAYARAELMARDDPDAGTRYLRQAMDRSGQAQSYPWKLVWARYLDDIRSDKAQRVWISLADQNPRKLPVQRMALDARAVQDNRDFLDRVIDRIKSMTGQQGMSWRLARARYLLGGDASDADVERSIAMLTNIVNESPDLLKGRLYLAAALQKGGDTGAALDQLAAASTLSPRSQAIVLQRAKLHLRRGDYEEAIRLANAAADAETATPDQKQRAAMVLAQAGDTQAATAMLEASNTGEGSAADLALAKLYQRRNELQKANNVYRKLMKAATPSAVRSYANFLGAIGRREDALRILRSLDQMNIDPVVRRMILAEFHRDHGDASQAVKHYQAAIKAAPEKEMPRRRLIGFYLEQGRPKDALAANASARKAMPDKPLFSLIANQRELIASSSGDSLTRPLVSALIDQPDQRQTVLEALRLLRDIRRDGEVTSSELIRMRRLTDQHPRFLALQNTLTDVYLRAGRYSEAADIASRAMEAFPLEASPAQKATLALRAQQRWNDAAAMGRRWRQRSLDDPLGPDLFLADTYLKMDQPRRALEQLDPYRQVLQENPKQLPRLVSVYSEALVSAGRVDQAAGLLKPLLAEDTGWRSIWNALAVNDIQSAETASAWLEQVEPVIPAEAVGERINLANHWAALGERLDRPAYERKSLEMLRSIAEADEAPVEAVLAYAIRASDQGQASIAEKQYRRALRKNPDLAIAQNNLALLLMERGDTEEALRLARAARDANPGEANFHDTLANIQMAQGRYEKAIANLKRAMELQPDRAEWRVNLAAAHAANGEKDAASRLLSDLDTSADGLENLSPEARQRLEELRASLSGRQAAAP